MSPMSGTSLSGSSGLEQNCSFLMVKSTGPSASALFWDSHLSLGSASSSWPPPAAPLSKGERVSVRWFYAGMRGKPCPLKACREETCNRSRAASGRAANGRWARWAG